MSDKNERPLAYPQPTETDQMLKNQDEYTERQNNRTSEEMPLNDASLADSDKVREADENARS